MALTDSNTYIEPTAGTSLGTARTNQNKNFRSLLTNFYSTTAPTSVNLTVDAVPLAIPNGMLFRHQTNGALYIADSVNQQGAPIGGNFTRVGIGNRVEANTNTLTTNASSYEIGELVATLDSGNETVYLCKGTGSGFPTDFFDISSPSSYVVDAQNNVTIQAPRTTVADFVAETSANVQGDIFVDAYIRHNADNSLFGFPNNDTFIIQVAGATAFEIDATSNTIVTNDLLVSQYVRHANDADTYLRFTPNRARINVGGVTAISASTASGVDIAQSVNLSEDIHLLDTKKVFLGTDNDVELHFGGSNFNIDVNNGGNIYIRDGNSSDVNRFIFDVDTGDFEATNNVTVGGNLTASGEVTAYSDEVLKTNIETIDSALDKVSKMRGVYFDKDGKRSTGVIAQEIEKVLPEVVLDGDFKSVAYGNIVGILIEAIKDLSAKVEELEKSNQCL